MARYRMDDGTVLDTDNATQHWDEETDWDGSNWISRPTKSQWHHETLYRSRKGRYYIESTSQYQGDRPRAEWISKRQAASWLLLNEWDIPDDLVEAAETVSE